MPESDLPAGRRRPGRPRSTEPKTCLSTWVSLATYDRLAHAALRRDISVSKLARDVLTRAVTPQKPDEPR